MPSNVREFVGLGAHEGWRFTMEPALLTATGAPGYNVCRVVADKLRAIAGRDGSE